MIVYYDAVAQRILWCKTMNIRGKRLDGLAYSLSCGGNSSGARHVPHAVGMIVSNFKGVARLAGGQDPGIK